MLMTNMIEIKNLSKSYKDFLLKNVSFNVPKGFIMGFVGQNGAGKTTTMRSLLGMADYDGECLILDEPTSGLDPVALNSSERYNV